MFINVVGTPGVVNHVLYRYRDVPAEIAAATLGDGLFDVNNQPKLGNTIATHTEKKEQIVSHDE